jgi:hypothetical protein
MVEVTASASGAWSETPELQQKQPALDLHNHNQAVSSMVGQTPLDLDNHS